MRSVAVHVRSASQSEVGEFLQRTYPLQQGPPWIADIAGDACLYINWVSFEELSDYEPDVRETLLALMEAKPFVSVSADLSGRHAGIEQAHQFVGCLLARFGGVAEDDYTDHFWTWKEIVSNHLVENHPFFDCAGWYAGHASQRDLDLLQ